MDNESGKFMKGNEVPREGRSEFKVVREKQEVDSRDKVKHNERIISYS